MFVYVAAWDNLTPHEQELPLTEKIALMTKHAGVSVLVTSLTDFVAFTVGAITVRFNFVIFRFSEVPII